MRSNISVEADWQNLISKINNHIDLDATARASNALVRKRCVGDAATLLRLAGLGIRRWRNELALGCHPGWFE